MKRYKKKSLFNIQNQTSKLTVVKLPAPRAKVTEILGGWEGLTSQFQQGQSHV